MSTQPPAKKTPVESVKITLIVPINIGGVAVDALTVRRPKLRDRILSEEANPDGSIARTEMAFVANLCEVAPDELMNLDFADWRHLQDEVTKMQKYPQ